MLPNLQPADPLEERPLSPVFLRLAEAPTMHLLPQVVVLREENCWIEFHWMIVYPWVVESKSFTLSFDANQVTLY